MQNSFIYRDLRDTLSSLFGYFQVITITGPRQSGKTTLCRTLYPELPYFNLEDMATLAQVQQDPKRFLSMSPTGMIIDEVQRFESLFSYLQVLVDEDRIHGNTGRHFILTGSANFTLMQKISQSMAGRTAVVTLLPFSNSEISSSFSDVSTDRRILNGGYPAVWTNDESGRAFLLSNYFTTYVERDLRQLINIKDLRAFQTFIRLCAGRIGSEYVASNLAVEVGVSVPTIQSWVSILEASYILYLLPPYYANIKKRLVKTPKIYFYDTGLAAWLLGINTSEQLALHPLRGGLFENMVINDKIKTYYNRGEQPNFYYYRDQQQHEVDLLELHQDGTISAFEIKSGQTYRTDYLKGLQYIQNVLGDKIIQTQVIYDGQLEQPSLMQGAINYLS